MKGIAVTQTPKCLFALAGVALTAALAHAGPYPPAYSAATPYTYSAGWYQPTPYPAYNAGGYTGPTYSNPYANPYAAPAMPYPATQYPPGYAAPPMSYPGMQYAPPYAGAYGMPYGQPPTFGPSYGCPSGTCGNGGPGGFGGYPGQGFGAGAGGFGGQGGVAVFGSHPFARSPRDFFMQD